MNFKYMSFFVVFALYLASAQSKALQGSKVKLTLLYESLCPFCRQFITDQLYYTYKQFGSEYITLEMIPFGNAQVDEGFNGTITASCQHGIKECYGNKVHGCALAHNLFEDSLSFIYCAESSEDPTSDDTFQKCAYSSNIPWFNLQSCINSGEGDNIFLENGDKTTPFNHSYVPWIVVNGVHDETTQDEAQRDLKKLICKLLNNQPAVC